MNKRSESGFTLLEVMIVLGLIAVSYFAFFTFGFGDKSAVRQEIRNLSGRIRYIYNLAATESRYYRVTFDLDDGTYLTEVSEEPIAVAKTDPEAEVKPAEEDVAKNQAQGDDEEAPQPQAAFAESENELLEPFKLENGVRFCSVYVEHQTEPVLNGKAEIHFFPRGQTEFAVIQLCDAEGDHVMTLSVNPVTGAIAVFDGAKNYEEILEDNQR